MLEPKTESKVAMNRLKDFLAWLDSELGVGYESSGSSPNEKIFLYVSPTKRKNTVRIMGKNYNCAILLYPLSSNTLLRQISSYPELKFTCKAFLC